MGQHRRFVPRWNPDRLLRADLPNGTSRVTLWDARNGTLLKTYPPTSAVATALAMLPDGSAFVTVAAGMQALEFPSGTELFTLNNIMMHGFVLSISSDGATLYAGLSEAYFRKNSLGVIGAVNGSETGVILQSAFPSYTNAIGAQPSSTMFAACGYLTLDGTDSAVRVWDSASGALLATVNYTGLANHLIYTPDGRFLAVGGGNPGQIPLYSTHNNSYTWMRDFVGHTTNVYSIAFSPDGTRLVSGGGDRTVRIWDVASGEQIKLFPVSRSPFSVAMTPDNQRVFVCLDIGAITMLNATTGETLVSISSDMGEAALSPDGSLIASAINSTIIIYDSFTGKVVTSLESFSPLKAFTFSPSGELLYGFATLQSTLFAWRLVD
jgi:WD40 repeat protein